MKALSRVVTNVSQALTIALFAGLPLLFLPFTQDAYDTNKWMLLVTVALALVALAGVNAALTNTLTITVSPLSLGFAGLMAAALVSLLVSSPNRIEAMLLPIGVGTLIALTLVTLLSHHVVTGYAKAVLRTLLIASASLAGLVAILQFFDVGKLVTPTLPFLADPLWTPVGSSVGLVLYLLLILPLAGQQLLIHLKKQHPPASIGLGVATALMGIGIIVTLIRFIPVLPNVMMPLATGWAVLLEVLKNPRQAATGVGLENFIAAYTTGKPLTTNASGLWTLRFGLSASFLLHVLTTLGFVGLAAAILFLKALLPKRQELASVSLLVGLAAFLLLPPNLTILVTLTAVYLLTQTSERYERSWKLPKSIVSIVILVMFVVLSLTGLYFVGRAYAAELTFAQSLAAASQNKGTETYNLQIKAIGQNPYVARYHLTYSRTNLALASAITQGPPSTDGSTTPKTLTDTDRATVTQLIQQAIREAKVAVNLAPNNAFMWENLATVYQTLIGVANGAENWTVASLQRAIQLDPANPILRVNLGGVYVTQNMHEEATQQFLIAANLKPDWANAYYNLANAYRISGNTDRAITALEKTLTLVEAGTSDHAKATNELNELKSQAIQPEVKAPETLTEPPSGEPIVVPPLTLPESSSPNDLPTPQPASPSTEESPQPSL